MPKFVRFNLCGFAEMHRQEVHLCSHSILENCWVSSSDLKINRERLIISLPHWLVGIKTWTTGCRNYTMTRLQRERERESAKTTMQINDIWRDRDLYVEHR